MPARSKAQRQAMAIAEHHPSELYSRNKGLAKMSHSQLHDFAATKEKHLPEYKNPSPKHAPHNPGRIEHVHEHLSTDHIEGPTHKGKTVDGHDHDGHVAGTLPAHKHHGVVHHYSKG